MVARSCMRAAKIASGSTSRAMSRAISASLGMIIDCATKAGSSERSDRIAPSAAIRPSSWRSARPARWAATLSISRVVASVCTACQRLNGSVSRAARKRRSSADWSAMIFTGAEKPRLSETTGGAATSANVTLCAGSVSTTTPRSTGLPSARLSGSSLPSGRGGRPPAGSPSAPWWAARESAAPPARDRAGTSWPWGHALPSRRFPACRPGRTSA